MCYNEMDENVYKKRVEWDVYGRPTGHLWRRRGVPHSGGGTLLPVRNGQNQALLYADASDPQRHGADPGGYQGADAPHPHPAGGGGPDRPAAPAAAGGAGEPQYASAEGVLSADRHLLRLPPHGGSDPLRRPPPQARPADRAQGQPDGRALPAPGGERSLR